MEIGTILNFLSQLRAPVVQIEIIFGPLFMDKKSLTLTSYFTFELPDTL